LVCPVGLKAILGRSGTDEISSTDSTRIDLVILIDLLASALKPLFLVFILSMLVYTLFSLKLSFELLSSKLFM
jgi:hypothetical protein